MSLFIVLAENLCLILKWQTVYSTPVPIARHISPYPLGAWRATLLRRQGDLFSAIDSGRRILMNNAG